MATVESSYWKKRIPAPVGNPESTSFLLSVTATPGATSDVLKLTKVPRGVQFVDCFVQATDGDTNATPTAVFSLEIYDGTTTKTLIHESTILQGGGLIRPTLVGTTENGIGFTTNNDNFYLRIVYDTGAATAASATINVGLTLSGWYPYGAVTE